MDGQMEHLGVLCNLKHKWMWKEGTMWCFCTCSIVSVDRLSSYPNVFEDASVSLDKVFGNIRL